VGDPPADHDGSVPARVEAVMGWGGRHRRDLPWRRTRDPWAVLVAEVMLQQTQVARVEPRWSPWMSRWPTPTAQAAASQAEVVRAWQGLGYPRRARNLLLAAQRIVEGHHGSVPEEETALLALPGVGPYTARAVRVFAFELDEGVLDTNVGRVLARWHGARLRPADARRVADAQVPPGAGWAWNQTLLDLAATVCTKRAPSCEACPVPEWCAWAGSGLAPPDPAEGSAAVSRRQGRFEGSLRQARGRALRLLADGPLRAAEVRAGDELAAALTSLADDGLVVLAAEVWRLGGDGSGEP
jgi:A/G-specific adenine glycosylase